MLNKYRWLFLFAGGVGMAMVLMSCEEPAPAPQIPAPATRAQLPPPGTRSGIAKATPAPIILQKPRLLGPLTPAIIPIPVEMSEPLIRVKLTDESSVRPNVRQSNYHGRVETVTLPNGKYVAINVLRMDDYLAGVLAKEILNSWDAETFRAQAIAARTFALYQIMNESNGTPWDVSNDVKSQMYGGIKGETAKSRGAVAATRGQVLTASLNGRTGIFCSFYSACDGGATQDPFDAWGDASLPELAARRIGSLESFSPEAHYTWPMMSVDKADITRCVRSWGERNGFGYLAALGEIESVTISKRNAATGRPTEILLTDTANHHAPIRAEEFRQALIYDPTGETPKPPSSFFEIQDAGASIHLVNGRGHGHGIGMSQWGAQALALQGRTHTQILAFFYPGASLRELW